jgi:uncharacterized protein (DUF983 family)
MLDRQAIKLALACKCPRCGQGGLYPSRFNLDLKSACDVCGLNLAKNDSADGPAVFLIFILGFLLVPLALLFENIVAPPLWVHGVIWGGVAIFITLGTLRPLKAYIIALQYKHRPGDWE